MSGIGPFQAKIRPAHRAIAVIRAPVAREDAAAPFPPTPGPIVCAAGGGGRTARIEPRGPHRTARQSANFGGNETDCTQSWRTLGVADAPHRPPIGQLRPQ
jgi:hypothetical protein